MTSEARILPAPAKLNLGLRVLGRRPDGYHLIESLFVPLDLADRVEVRRDSASDGPDGESDEGVGLRFDLEWAEGARPDPGVPRDCSNLAARAALRFLERAGLAGSLTLRLLKRIPSGAGLGGGSSDAGTVLRALQQHYPGELCEEDLAELALELGADVPFFLSPRPALVTGIGEQIQPLADFPRLWLLLVNPGISLATAAVFRAWDEDPASLTPVEPGSTMRALQSWAAASRPITELFDSGLLVNDLEPAARRLCPEMGSLLKRLGELGAAWRGMSGSGATVYGIFPSEEAASAALQHAGFGPGVWACVAHSSGRGGS